LTLIGIAGLVALPLLPSSYTNRMNTIEGYQADSSASTRLAVWAWTWGYVQEHPMGGGFESYRQNQLTIQLSDVQKAGGQSTVSATTQTDQGRAFHSAYFEMLGEQGFPGIALWLLLHLSGLLGMEKLRRNFKNATADEAWIAPLATALQHGQIIYLIGALFVGIAFQPFIFMLIGVQIALVEHVRRMRQGNGARPFFQAKKAVTA
jgi:O-antigen ligase